jgi:hypothetical protein
MITILGDFPVNVLALNCSGQVTERDYATVVIPAVEKALTSLGWLRLYYQIGPTFTGFEPGAMWDDFLVGVDHLSRWERVAVVTDLEWVKFATRAFGFLLPGKAKVFALADADAARAWITSK